MVFGRLNRAHEPEVSFTGLESKMAYPSKILKGRAYIYLQETEQIQELERVLRRKLYGDTLIPEEKAPLKQVMKNRLFGTENRQTEGLIDHSATERFI